MRAAVKALAREPVRAPEQVPGLVRALVRAPEQVTARVRTQAVRRMNRRRIRPIPLPTSLLPAIRRGLLDVSLQFLLAWLWRPPTNCKTRAVRATYRRSFGVIGNPGARTRSRCGAMSQNEYHL